MTVKVKVYVHTNVVGSRCEDTVEFEDSEWATMSEKDKEDILRDAAFNYVDWGWEIQE